MTHRLFILAIVLVLASCAAPNRPAPSQQDGGIGGTGQPLM